MARRRRGRRLGTIKSRQSRAMLGGLGDLRSGMLHDVLPPVMGGVVAGLATFGVRQFMKPLADDGTTPNPYYRWAPAIGLASGVLTGGAAYFMAGKGRAGAGAAAAAFAGALLVTAPQLVSELQMRSLAQTDQAAYQAHLLAVTANTVAIAPAPTSGVGVIVPSPKQLMGVNLGRMHPSIRIISGIDRRQYGQTVFN